jgi:hypothetical protein
VHKLLLYIFLLFANCIANAQGYTAKNYSVEHGLPFIQVRGSAQDSNGYIYVFGYGGIGKFESIIFYHFL